MKKSLKLFIGIVVMILAVVAIFTMFADSFTSGNLPDSRPSPMMLAFTEPEKSGYNEMPILVVAFSFLVAGAVLSIISMIFPGKLALPGYVLTFGLLLAAAVIFFLGKNIFMEAQASAPGFDALDRFENANLGPGFIVPAIFALLGSVLSLYAAYRSLKA